MAYLDAYSNELKGLCILHKVKTLYAFGSAVSGQVTSQSDIDFIVDFDKVDLTNYADNYFALKFSLQDMFKRKIDLIEETAIKNPYFQQAVNKQRKLVYGH